jgi:hypothetical protein
MKTKLKFQKNTNLLILISLCWIFIISIYLLNIKAIYDPFYLMRLAEINSNINNFNLTVFQDLPYTYFYNVVLVRILGDNIIQNGFIPLVQFIGLFSLLVFGKSIYEKFKNPYRSLFFIIPIAVFSMVFLTSLPYQEYYIGYALYPLFLWGFLKYTNEKSYQLAILLILIFITIHFFAIPMSAWIIQFVLIYFLLLYFARFFSKNENDKKYAISSTFVILLVVIWIFWNYKFFNGIATNTFNLDTLINLLKDMVYSRNTGNLSDFMYITIGSNPITIWAGRTILVLTYIPIALVFLYELSKRNLFFFLHSKEDVFIISLIFPFIIEFLVYGSSGLLSFRYSNLIFPFISYYYVLKYLGGKNRLSRFKFINLIKINNHKLINLFLIIFVFCSLITVYSHLNNINSQVPSDSVKAVSNWYPNYIYNDSNLVTDYQTDSYFNYYLKSKDYNYYSNRIPFTQNIYAYLTDPSMNSSDTKLLKYFMVDNKDLNKPLIQGPPAWVTLQPLSQYIDKINSNTNMRKIYDSGSIIIYEK